MYKRGLLRRQTHSKIKLNPYFNLNSSRFTIDPEDKVAYETNAIRMAFTFTLEHPMPPIWMRFPNISQYSIGWRMGYGEDYKWQWSDWLDTLSPTEQSQYQILFPHPIFWREYYNADFDYADILDYECEHVQLWRKKGEMKYSLATIRQPQETSSFLFFWRPEAGVINSSCLGQWQPSYFEVDMDTYSCTEQYMMAEKARLFEDEETEALIMATTDPKKMKALGKKVKNFNQTTWDKAKYAIVLNGNYYKFAQNKAMRDFLLATGDQILVEASPLDTIWGIGLAEEDPQARDISSWKGQNLLGFALMEVRDELRKLYQNYDRIPWDKF